MTWQQFLFSFDGRIGRKPYWIYFLVVTVLTLAVVIIDAVGDSTVLQNVFGFLVLWPNLAVSAKRWHDRDKSGWWTLIVLIPVLGALWAVIECGFLRGTNGPNRFGDAPDRSGGVRMELSGSTGGV